MRRRSPRRVEKLYDDHINLIRKRAWVWSNRTGVQFEDLLSIGHACFMYCVQNWDSGRGAKFSSLLATRCNQRMAEYTLKMPPTVHETDDDRVTSHYCLPDQLAMFMDDLTVLSEEAKAVVDILLNAPNDVWKCLHGRRATKIRLRRALREACYANGQKTEDTDKGFKELDRVFGS